MNRKFKMIVLFICLQVLFQSLVYADSYNQEFRNTLGEMVTYTVNKTENGYVISVDNISVSAGDPDTAYAEMRRRYFSEILLPKAKVEDPELYRRLIEEQRAKQEGVLEDEDIISEGVNNIMQLMLKGWRVFTILSTIIALIAIVITLIDLLNSSSHPAQRYTQMLQLKERMLFLAFLGFDLSSPIIYFIIRFILRLQSDIPMFAKLEVYGAIGADYLIAILIKVIGLALLTGLLMFSVRFTQLATSADNPEKRGRAINSLFYVGIFITVIGNFGIFASLVLDIF
ncbi:hypothetical protein [Brassicibacter mesophilus]|uniref:hypothetical protein n=1 Tax=Brassicibacter mesophilus TaxID=745119 RepID=UPI003D1F0384